LSLALRLSLPLARFGLDVELETRSRALGVFGPSGSGKTSLLEAVAGWRGARGRIALGGRVLLDSSRGLSLPIEARGIGYVPQEGLLFPHWSVRRNVEAGLARGRGTAARAEVGRVVEVLELGGLLERPANAISGGERQRVALARALCSGPELLLLDEPLASLDLPLRRRVLSFLIRAREAFDVPLVFVSHDPTEVQALCDEVAVLDAGRIVARGSPREALRGILRPHAGFENVLRGRVAAVEAGTAHVEVAPGVALVVPGTGLVAGEDAVLALGADEVLLAMEAPRRISARNVIAARVETVVEGGEGVMLEAALGGETRLWVALTGASMRELGLARGGSVHLVFKTQSVRILSGKT